MEDVNKQPWISFSLSKLDCGPQEINSREIFLHLPFSANWNKAKVTKIEKMGIHFKTDVFATVAVVNAKTPWYMQLHSYVTMWLRSYEATWLLVQ